MATYHVEVEILQGAADWAHLPIANQAMVYAGNRSNLCAGATEEYLIGDVEFSAVYLSLAGNATKLPGG
jgi:hypothetical protein